MSNSYRTSGTDLKDGFSFELQTYPPANNLSENNHKQQHLTAVSADDDGIEAGIGKYGLQPSYSKELGLDDIPHGFYGTMMNCLGETFGFFGSVGSGFDSSLFKHFYSQFPCLCCFPNPYKRVKQGSVGLVSRFGKFYKCVDPGLVKINPITEQIRRVDITIQITDIPRQDIMTKDNVNIAIESVLYWHIVDPYEAEYGVTDVNFALVERARTSLRDVCGSHSLQDLIENRDAISAEIREIIDPISHRWGVKVEATLIKDITFSQQLQESLSSAATAKRLGESRVIASRAEVEAAKLMRDAADILATPAAMQLRQLETLTTMSRNAQGPKTIFIPLPSSGEQLSATIHAS
ncbi:hypothetical protein DFQ28_007003 [Apophysomyces sp. BC1034]|nr:hypothetical protein DFQ30_009618 [Apophysomyces sp. BC1015]KAG0182206.1 hypothetical protein DFQ29_005261 [Apophysomyces sp. BC1021]KAG0192971.1 hypothetical protein DFQ28_007003 [Apophysomyces sp. BC1034]